MVVVGAGGHGLATAYYLAKNHGITDVAVIEKGWLGGGNMARNTTIIRSNYLWDESAAIYEHSLKLWEGLEEALDFDMQFSQRGVLNLAHDLGDVRTSMRRVHANRLNGVDAEWLDPAEVKAFCPIVERRRPTSATRCSAATLQRRGGIARHDKVAWGFARGADRLGVDIVEHCEVTGFLRGDGGRVAGVETTRGTIRANTVALAAAGHTSVLASMAGLRLPIQSHPLQALVSVLLEPVLDCVVMSNAVHVYVSQADKGELVMGAGHRRLQLVHAARRRSTSSSTRWPPRSSCSRCSRTPGCSGRGAGIVDVCPDASPIIGPTPIDGLFLNCGWGTGGFKATPGSGWVYADTIANGEPHPLAEPYALERFTTGALIDEHGAAGVAH